VGIETGPKGGGRRLNRARFQSRQPKTNDHSSPNLVANRATSFRLDCRPFRAGLEQPNEALDIFYLLNKYDTPGQKERKRLVGRYGPLRCVYWAITGHEPFSLTVEESKNLGGGGRWAVATAVRRLCGAGWRRRRRQPSRPSSRLQLARRDEAAGAKCRQWYNPVAGDGCNGRPKARCTHPPRRLAAAPVSGIERARAPGVSLFPTHPRLSLPCRKFQSRSNGSVGSERGKGALMNSLPAAEAFGSFRLP